jgi:hypothetical protein
VIYEFGDYSNRENDKEKEKIKNKNNAKPSTLRRAFRLRSEW